MRARGEAPVAAGLWVAVWLLLAALWWAGWDGRPLARPDEGRYAEIAREMLQSGDWVTPRLNGIKYFEKPPLQYWATAAAYRVLGVNERSARLWTVLCGFITLAAAAWLAGGSGAPAAASLLAPVILAGAFYPALLGHINTLDTGVTAFLTASLAAYLQSRQGGNARLWMGVAGALAGLAMLSKGLIALALPGVGLIIYTFLSRELSAWRELYLPTALSATLLVAGPWFALCSVRNPEFAQFFFIHEHLERFTSEVHRRVEPVWYFLPLLLIGLLPWTATLPAAVARAWSGRTVNPAGFRPLRFLLAYAAGVIAFFSLSGSKLPGYILPAFPALAVILAHGLTQAPRLPRGLLATGAAALTTLCIAAALLLGVPGLAARLGIPLDLDPDMVDPYAQFAPWLGTGGGLLALGTLCMWLMADRLRVVGCAALGFTALGAATCGLHGATELAPFNSAGPWIASIARELPRDGRLYSVGTYDQTLDFYLGRTVILVDFLDELEFGLAQEPALAIPGIARFTEIWGRSPEDRAILEPARFDALQHAGLKMRVVARDPRHVIVSPP